jgi:hypothetical protein
MVEQDCGWPLRRFSSPTTGPTTSRAAEARGWNTHLFEGPQGWADRLVAEGLLTADGSAGMSVETIPFAEGEARLDWLGLIEALARGHGCRGPRSPTRSSTGGATRS